MAASDHFVITEEVKWKAFLQLNRTRMVTDLDYETLAAEAMKRGITDETEVKRIKFNSTANFRRVGVFLDNLLKKTKDEYLKFRDCLKHMDEKAKAVDDMLEKEYPGYVESLNEQMKKVKPRRDRGSRRQGDAECQFGPQDCASLEDIDRIKREVHRLEVPSGFQTSIHSFYQTNRGECYEIGRGIRGRALIVAMTGNRDGWKQDVLALAKMFKALQFEFELTTYIDPKHHELRVAIQQFAKAGENEESDCIFVVLMGHGGRTNDTNKDYLITADGCAYWVEEELQENFNNIEAEHLREKPKVFLSQMCRGTNEDQGVLISDASRYKVLPKWTDFLFGHSTLPGNKAYRDDKRGSWYIQTLVEVFLAEAHDQSVTDMLTKVNRKVNEKTPEIKQATVMTASLNHKLFLFPGI